MTVKQLNPTPSANGSQPTNANLFQLYEELNRLPNILKHLLRSKIQEFDKNNGARFNTIKENIGKLQQEHFVVINGQIQFNAPLLDDKGAPVTPQEPQKPKLQDGKTHEQFTESVQKLMAQTTVIV